MLTYMAIAMARLTAGPVMDELIQESTQQVAP